MSDSAVLSGGQNALIATLQGSNIGIFEGLGERNMGQESGEGERKAEKRFGWLKDSPYICWHDIRSESKYHKILN